MSIKDRNASAIVQTFIDAEDAMTVATRNLRVAKGDLIKDLIHQGRYDLFTLNINSVYREFGIVPKRHRS